MSTSSGRSRWSSLRSGAVVAVTALVAVTCGKAPTPAAEAPEFMFVQIAEDMQVDTTAMTLRLVKVSHQTLFFSDRPNRIAGHIRMEQYLKEWTPAAGADNLGADPPNATLSVYEPGQADNSIAIVEISDPRLDGADLVYHYTLVDGAIPLAGGETTLFIDKIGVGGGVGPGTPGVGVGGPGVGVR